MEEQYSEDDDGPLPGWDNSHQQTEQLSTPAVISSGELQSPSFFTNMPLCTLHLKSHIHS